MIYDGLILIAIWMLIAAVYIFVVHLATKGVPENALILQFTLFPIEIFGTFLFFDYFWRTKGQTLGMLAWKIKLENNQGDLVDRRTALIRWSTSVFSLLAGGIGYWTAIIRQDKRTLHDVLSDTRVIHTTN